MKNIHVGLGYSEAVEAKRDLLLCEESILKTIKIMRNYKILRKREFSLKSGLRKSMSSFSADIKKLQGVLPEGVVGIKVRKIKKPAKEDRHNQDIEEKLLEIREKLARLG